MWIWHLRSQWVRASSLWPVCGEGIVPAAQNVKPWRGGWGWGWWDRGMRIKTHVRCEPDVPTGLRVMKWFRGATSAECATCILKSFILVNSEWAKTFLTFSCTLIYGFHHNTILLTKTEWLSWDFSSSCVFPNSSTHGCPFYPSNDKALWVFADLMQEMWQPLTFPPVGHFRR